MRSSRRLCLASAIRRRRAPLADSWGLVLVGTSCHLPGYYDYILFKIRSTWGTGPLRPVRRSVTMRITIFGANGGTGRQLTELALTAGHYVWAVTRHPQRRHAQHRQGHVTARNQAFGRRQLKRNRTASSCRRWLPVEPRPAATDYRNHRQDHIRRHAMHGATATQQQSGMDDHATIWTLRCTGHQHL